MEDLERDHQQEMAALHSQVCHVNCLSSAFEFMLRVDW